MDHSSHRINYCNDKIWRRNNFVPNERVIWEGRFPIEIMDHKALVAYCRLLEELLMRRHPEKINPAYDCQQQQVESFNKQKTRAFTQSREHDTVVSSNVATQVEISDKEAKSHSSNVSSPN